MRRSMGFKRFGFPAAGLLLLLAPASGWGTEPTPEKTKQISPGLYESIGQPDQPIQVGPLPREVTNECLQKFRTKLTRYADERRQRREGTDAALADSLSELASVEKIMNDYPSEFRQQTLAIRWTAHEALAFFLAGAEDRAIKEMITDERVPAVCFPSWNARSAAAKDMNRAAKGISGASESERVLKLLAVHGDAMARAAVAEVMASAAPRAE